MGAPTLEAQLRSRVLCVAIPALLAVGIASVAITSWVLDTADRDAAQARAADVLRVLRSEAEEGDPIQIAAVEAVQSDDTSGVRVSVRGPGLAWRSGSLAMMDKAFALDCGTCTKLGDDAGHLWVACAQCHEPFGSIVAISLDAHRLAVGRLARSTLGVVALTLIALAWAVRRAVRGSVESIGKLVVWTEHVDGQPTAPPTADTVEIQRLVHSFDQLVRRLLDALSRERANSAHIAHELRTPLTSMLAELDRLAASQRQPALDRVHSDCVHLARVIDSVLVLSAPPDARVDCAVVNVADLVREEAGTDIEVDAPEEALVEGDERLLALALRNLLDNAQRYSGHKALSVRVSRTGQLVRLAVLDDGPGLDAAKRSRMFDRYWRADKAPHGTGLGLALVRAVAQRHGGTAEAIPNPVGPGLQVAFTIGPVVGWHD